VIIKGTLKHKREQGIISTPNQNFIIPIFIHYIPWAKVIHEPKKVLKVLGVIGIISVLQYLITVV
jgi:hypothetical protein